MSTYMNSHVFELYNFSALVPESYIAQTVGLLLMAMLAQSELCAEGLGGRGLVSR